MKLAIFLINLDRDADRLSHMAGQFAREGLAFTRLPAVYGLAMPDWMKPYFLDSRDQVASRLKPGEIGCYASHLLAARTLLDTDAPFALICEDDLALPEGFAALLRSASAALPAGWDILRLSNPAKAPYTVLARLTPGHDLVRYSRVPNNTGCQLLSRTGAEKLLRPGLRYLAIDEHLRRPWLLGLETYGVIEPPVRSNIFDSTIDAMGDRGLSRENWLDKIARRQWGRPEEWIAQIRWQIAHLGLGGWMTAIALGAAYSLLKPLNAKAAAWLRARFAMGGSP